MGQVATVDPEAGGNVVAVGSASTMMEIIARAASDPNTDVDKLERLMAMAERIEARNNETAFNASMTAAQTKIRPIAADASNPQTRSKYASYLALDKALRPIYTEHGFSLSFDTGDGAPEGCIRVLCYVAHSAGHSRTYRLDMPADGKGAKGGDVMTKTHAAGAAMTYGQRYLLKLVFNIAVGEDDDGNSPGGDESLITEDQFRTICDLIARGSFDVTKVCEYARVATIKEVKKKDYEPLIVALNTKLRDKAKAK